MSHDTTRQALALKTLVDNFDVEKWPSDDDGSVTYVESFRTVRVWREGDEVFAHVATNAGTDVTLAGDGYELVRYLVEAVGVTGADAGDGA